MAPKKAVAALIIALLLKKRSKRRRTRRVWVRQWIRNRPTQGAYNHLLRELRMTDSSGFRNFLRMDECTFEVLLAKVAPLITHKDTKMRKAIPAGERLALTLRFLSTGESFVSLQYLYRIASQTVGKIVLETCEAISSVLEDCIKVPTTEVEWKRIAEEFNERWNFPHCIGAMDGKHVLIKPPPNSGSVYFNYKHSFSIVLLAVVDADYKFIYIDVGCNGRVADGGVFRNCSLSKALEENKLHIPPPEPLPNQSGHIPYMLVADDAFPLKEYLQKPYAQSGLTREKRIYNYRLSRARRIVENVFGILANRFRIFRAPIPLNPEKVIAIVMACCSLHNFLRTRVSSRIVYTPRGSLDFENTDNHTVMPGTWRQESSAQGLIAPPRLRGNRQLASAKAYRDQLREYFNSPDGAVAWQDKMI
jgi:hypothetical protein